MSKKNAFATYINDSNLNTNTVAHQLKISKAYIHLLARNDTTPSLKLAGVIERWSKGEVTMQSWLAPQKGRPPGKKVAPKKNGKTTTPVKQEDIDDEEGIADGEIEDAELTD